MVAGVSTALGALVSVVSGIAFSRGVLAPPFKVVTAAAKAGRCVGGDRSGKPLRHPKTILSPLRGLIHLSHPPTAYAVGFILSPRCGLLSESPAPKVLWRYA